MAVSRGQGAAYWRHVRAGPAEQTWRAYGELAQRRLRPDEEHGDRLGQLAEREAEFVKEPATRPIHVTGMAMRLGETPIAPGKERHARTTLREGYDQLADEFNQLVQETTQDRTAPFTRTPAEARPVPRLIPTNHRRSDGIRCADTCRGGRIGPMRAGPSLRS
ncbi:hypothetical protein [Streptomyces sp. MI02-7b]|uniref:hypothetical protein n=1 Tax=Streptomyces sp. MI02-7b TaxID=462941 RepID=UPI0029A6D10B|nr:hypothetical protein [Streptomyces sp. MI02-7b]MDX3072792.1 hypothetical protein [Streptomyces sp. MI02-7b]